VEDSKHTLTYSHATSKLLCDTLYMQCRSWNGRAIKLHLAPGTGAASRCTYMLQGQVPCWLLGGAGYIHS
jgi:hypothetical protein